VTPNSNALVGLAAVAGTIALAYASKSNAAQLSVENDHFDRRGLAAVAGIIGALTKPTTPKQKARRFLRWRNGESVKRGATIMKGKPAQISSFQIRGGSEPDGLHDIEIGFSYDGKKAHLKIFAGVLPTSPESEMAAVSVEVRRAVDALLAAIESSIGSL
jgi:hypothetical protein